MGPGVSVCYRNPLLPLGAFGSLESQRSADQIAQNACPRAFASLYLEIGRRAKEKRCRLGGQLALTDETSDHMIRVLKFLGLFPLAAVISQRVMLVVVSGILFTVGTYVAWSWLEELGLIVSGSIAFATILAIQITIREEQQQQYGQLEALSSTIPLLGLRSPLPRMRGWAISPDVAKLLVTLVNQESPTVVVEAGSGISTVILAYCLEKQGIARLYSLEHDRDHAEYVRAMLVEHQLDGVAKVIDAPLKHHELQGKPWLCYDLNGLDKIDDIDLLFIDGPPTHCQRLSRYPVLPLLQSKLRGNAVVVLDDAFRRDERRILAEWQKEFSEFSFELLPLEKGAAVLRRNTG